jgi:hypothetical protein
MREQAEWKKICEQAAHEQDPEKLMELARKIIELLDEGTADAQRRREASHRAPDPVGKVEVGQ